MTSKSYDTAGAMCTVQQRERGREGERASMCGTCDHVCSHGSRAGQVPVFTFHQPSFVNVTRIPMEVEKSNTEALEHAIGPGPSGRGCLERGRSALIPRCSGSLFA